LDLQSSSSPSAQAFPAFCFPAISKKSRQAAQVPAQVSRARGAVSAAEGVRDMEPGGDGAAESGALPQTESPQEIHTIPSAEPNARDLSTIEEPRESSTRSSREPTQGAHRERALRPTTREPQTESFTRASRAHEALGAALHRERAPRESSTAWLSRGALGAPELGALDSLSWGSLVRISRGLSRDAFSWVGLSSGLYSGA
jgi:hypothetical protein